MNSPIKIIEELDVDRDLLFRFFAVFSRFEYSLKRSGYLRKNTQRAEPDWDVYADRLNGKFGNSQQPEFQQALAFLLKAPPKTQIIAGNDLDWKDTVQGAGEHLEKYVLRLVRTIRNNLFHGGKYPYPLVSIDDGTRNRRLLEAGITILGQCLEFSSEVRAVFDEAA